MVRVASEPVGIVESARQIALAVAPAAWGRGISTEHLADYCVDLAIRLRTALRKPITYGPTGVVIGHWSVSDDARFVAVLETPTIKRSFGPGPEPWPLIAQAIEAYEADQRQRAGVVGS